MASATRGSSGSAHCRSILASACAASAHGRGVGPGAEGAGLSERRVTACTTKPLRLPASPGIAWPSTVVPAPAAAERYRQTLPAGRVGAAAVPVHGGSASAAPAFGEVHGRVAQIGGRRAGQLDDLLDVAGIAVVERVVVGREVGRIDRGRHGDRDVAPDAEGARSR